MQPIIIYGVPSGPNPTKVGIIVEELKIPYEFSVLTYAELKEETFLKLNPNGRAPAMKDPNTGIVLWETGAIIDYLIDHYDVEGTLTYKTEPEKYVLRQWMYFQVSGQGPYFGQAAWFMKFHKEHLPSAVERYQLEIKRVVNVLNTALEGKDYLVGDKCTYVDLAFVTWNQILPVLMPEFDLTEVPHYKKWNEKLLARPAVQKALADAEKRKGAAA